MNKQKRTRLVEHARKLVETRNNAKWAICKIALEVCEIQHGGGYIRKGMYTITKFAEDIGMHRKTLSCWILDYNYAKDAIDLEKPLSPEESKRIKSAISRARGAATGDGRGTKGEDAKEIKKKIEVYLEEDDNIWRLRAAIKQVKYFNTFFGAFKKINREERIYVSEFSDHIKELSKILKEL